MFLSLPRQNRRGVDIWIKNIKLQPVVFFFFQKGRRIRWSNVIAKDTFEKLSEIIKNEERFVRNENMNSLELVFNIGTPVCQRVLENHKK